MDVTSIELGPRMQACSELERKFVLALVTGPAETATDAARMAGYSDKANGCWVRAFELMNRERVVAAIEETARKEFRGIIPAVVKAARKLILNDKHPDHAKAVNSMLSRLGFAERSGVDVHMSGEVTMNATDKALDDLQALKALNFSREQLLEIFGYSGLDRFERMLTELDRGRPKAKLIDVTPHHGSVAATAPEAHQEQGA
jgi:phage terminase small subunit